MITVTGSHMESVCELAAVEGGTGEEERRGNEAVVEGVGEWI